MLRRDKIVDLDQDFDRMAEQLQRAVQPQRSLLHEVSHQLRSPLAPNAGRARLAAYPDRGFHGLQWEDARAWQDPLACHRSGSLTP